MQRSCSSNRVSDKLNSQSSSSSSSKKLSSSASLPSFILKQSEEEDDFLLLDDDELPIYHPKSYLAMKYKSRLRFADSAIHIIPFLLIFSALLLWFFSKPGYEGVLSVVPHKPTFPKTPFPIAIKNDTNLSIFNQRFHMILCYEKASSEDSGWIVAGWTKTSMMIALSEKPLLAGRLIRRVEDGGLEIVPNDSGIRLIEAQIPISLDEFVSMKNKEHVQKQLVFWESIDHQDPQFFPLMYLQVTKFMCGAYAIGISCSILAADPLSMSNFLKRWANIHINLVNESKTPKLPLLYLPKFDKPNSTTLYDPHDATLEDQTSGQTFIFKFPQTNHEMQRAVALSCMHKVKRKLGHKVTPNFTLLAKDPLNDMIKIDTVCVENVLESSPDFNEINVTNSSWRDYIDADGINIAKGHKPTDSFCCIFSPAEEGLVMMISSELNTTVIVTIPTKNNVIH